MSRRPLKPSLFLAVTLVLVGFLGHSALAGGAAGWAWHGAQTPGREPEPTVAGNQGAALAQTIVRSRRSITLLTREGTLVNLERMTVLASIETFRATLPPGSAVRMARVGGTSVRPVLTGSSVQLPLPGSDREHEIELLTVSEHAIPPDRKLLDFALLAVEAPVLKHEWRLLLPEEARYRFVEGSLLPVASTLPAGLEERGRGSAAVVGWVSASGHALPGVEVTLEIDGSKRQVLTDARGWYAFDFVRPGEGTVSVDLDAFVGSAVGVRLGRHTTMQANLLLQLDTSVLLVDPAPDIQRLKDGNGDLFDEPKGLRNARAFEAAAEALRQATVADVQLKVKIPRYGKVLLLAAVLPPPQAWAQLEVRRRQ